jgi:chemotaxis signal transduction protein
METLHFDLDVRSVPPPEPQGSAAVTAISTGETQQYVAFRVGSAHCCIAADSLSEVTQPLPVSRLPGSPSEIVGIAPLRENVLGVLNLQKVLGASICDLPSKPKFLILAAKEGMSLLAIRVDEMNGVLTLDPSSFEVSRNIAPCLAGTLQHQDKEVLCLDANLLRNLIETKTENPSIQNISS